MVSGTDSRRSISCQYRPLNLESGGQTGDNAAYLGELGSYRRLEHCNPPLTYTLVPAVPFRSFWKL